MFESDQVGLPLQPVLSVTELNRLARQRLEQAFPLLRVRGEISNCVRAPSGHVYFTLKDEGAQIRCAMWRNRAQLLGFQPQNGQSVEVRALVTLYEQRGDFQLNVESISLAGQGQLFEAFLRLKQRLAAEGLFDPALKRPLPRFPRGIAVITSPKAAAWQDVRASLARRAPHVPVVLYPAMVQGAQAPAELCAAVRTVSQRAVQDGVDVLLLVRGGGSLEDLAAFNDEQLARALRACPIPVVSGVGHETDFSISDFVSDSRATTPTMAAELVSAGFVEARETLPLWSRKLRMAMQRQCQHAAQRLDRAALRLVHPRDRLRHESAQLQRLTLQLNTQMARHLERRQQRLTQLAQSLTFAQPRLAVQQSQLQQWSQRLTRATHNLLARRQEQVATLASDLQHLSPQAVLQRGYTLTRDANGQLIRSATAVAVGAALHIEFADGKVGATVIETPDSQPSGI